MTLDELIEKLEAQRKQFGGTIKVVAGKLDYEISDVKRINQGDRNYSKLFVKIELCKSNP